MLKETGGNRALTRHKLRAAVYDCCPRLSRAKARELFDATFDELSDALIRGEPIKLRNFGTFRLRCKRERIGRNPKTGIEAVISARRVVTFSPSPVLIARVNMEKCRDFS